MTVAIFEMGGKGLRGEGYGKIIILIPKGRKEVR
jgi:hypothetical protein